MEKLKLIVIIVLLGTQCTLVAPDISGYIAALISLIPKAKQSSANSFAIKVTVTGLTGTGLILRNNGFNDLAITANGTSAFSEKITTGANYSVTILSQPKSPDQTCVVAGGVGTVLSGEVTSVAVNCSATTFTLGGNVAGYTSTGLVLANLTDGQTLSISANGSFAFTTTYILGTNYNVSIQTMPVGNACIITNNIGTIVSNIVAIAITCNPIDTLYVLNMQTQQIRAFTANADGTLTLLNTYATGMSAVVLLWNGKHVVIGGLNTLKSYLRNADGSLTLASTFTTANQIFSGGTPSFHPSGKFFYVNNINDLFLKYEIDTSGVFSGEVGYNSGCYVYVGPTHPTGNYTITFNVGCGHFQVFFPITNTTTGVLGAGVANAPHISAPPFFPEQADCAFSPNGNFLYCADAGDVGTSKSGGNIKQMSINATTLAPLAPFNVDPETPTNYVGPKSVIVHPNGNFLFVYGNTNVFSYNLSSATGLIGAQITSIPAPNSCGTSFNQITKLRLNSIGTYLYSICNNSGDVGSYSVSNSGVITAPIIYPTSGSTGGQTLLFVPGL